MDANAKNGTCSTMQPTAMEDRYGKRRSTKSSTTVSKQSSLIQAGIDAEEQWFVQLKWPRFFDSLRYRHTIKVVAAEEQWFAQLK
jgi:hypothetical protein